MLLTVVSCASKNSDKLFNDKILEIESTSTKLDTKGNNIISLDAKKNVLLSKEESGKTTYTLYNADSQSVIAESEYAFEFTKPNLYILKTPSSDNTATEYNFYTESGLIKNISVPNSSNVNNYFVVDTDESIRFSDGSSIQLVNGEAYKFFSSGEGNSPAPQFSTDDVKAGRFYYDVYNNCVSVFDSDKNFLRFTDVAAATGYNNDDIHFCGNVEEKLVFQVNINIPSDSKKYSYFVDSDKYDLITYTYNLKNGKIEEKKNFDFIIEKIDYIEDYSKCGLAYGYYINDSKTISSYIVQAFDDGLDVAVDIQAKLAEGKGPGYERWAKVFNLKQMAAALAYLQDNGLAEYSQLEQKAEEASDRFHALSGQIKQTETALKANMELKAATAQYAKTRPVFDKYKASKYSRKFLAEHEVDIELYRAAQADMRRLLGGAKLPKMEAQKEEGRKLVAKKKRLYGEYQKARRDMQEVLTIKANIDCLLGYSEQAKKKEMER